MPSNGNLPNYMLGEIPGGKLRRDAARHWNAMYSEIKSKTGIEIKPTGPRSSYRTLYWQRYFYNTMPRGMAAVPGTSNHGWGLAVDVATPAMAQAINKYGAKYGYQKAWSDAQHEWWHFKWREGNYGLKDKPASKYPVIKKGSKGKAVKRLQVYLRASGYLRSNRKVTDDYNIWIRRAVRKFQRNAGLKDDGIVNKKTWAALRRAAKRSLKNGN